MCQIGLGSRDGVVVFEGEPGKWREAFRALQGEDIVTLRFFPDDPDSFLAGSYGNGLFRVRGRGSQVERIAPELDYLRTVRFSPHNPSVVFAGTEPAELYRSRDRGDSWDSLNIQRLPQAANWSLPYSPRGGAMRSVILPAADPLLILAGVEQGGFLRSCDGGSTWQLEDREVDKDIHSLSISPENPAVIYAATGEGVFRSVDQGAAWRRLSEEYTRGVAVALDDPRTIFSGPAADVGEGGWINVSRDEGKTWKKTMKGLPRDPLADMVQVFFVWERCPDIIWALLSEGGLFTSRTSAIQWERLFTEVEGIQTIAFAPTGL